MNNKYEWNKELLYMTIFFIAAWTWFFWNPFGEIRDLIELSPNALDIKYKLLDLKIFYVFYNVANIAIAGSMIFLLSSMYTGIISLRKATSITRKGLC